MSINNSVTNGASDLMIYLDIAAKFRNNEFSVQILRNVIFTGFQAILLASYAATIIKYSYCSMAIAVFGSILSILWMFYYKSSLYWLWYWEYKCRQVNDEVLSQFEISTSIFEDHPIGQDKNTLPPLIFGGRTINHKPVHNVLQVTQWLFFFFWLGLLATAIVIFTKSYSSLTAI